MKFTDWIARALAYRRLKRQNPAPGTTLASKILYKMAWDRNPRLTVFADKVSVRNYIAGRVGDSYVVPVICVAETVQAIDVKTLPREYAVKVSHGSGGVIVVSERANLSATLPENPRVGWVRFEIHPDQLSPGRMSDILNHWMGLSYEWWAGRDPEWAYRGVLPRIVVEPLITCPEGGPPREYKVFCFNGHVQIIRVDHGSVSGGKVFTHYDREWNHLDVDFIETGNLHSQGVREEKPAFLSELIRVSEVLTDDVDFARVDLIDDNGSLRVGEITNYPTAGKFDFSPSDFGAWFGKDWRPHY